MLEVSQLSCGYGDIVAARDISFRLNSAEILALVGANGAGKSSTLMCVCGLVQQTQGSIRVEGEEISTLPTRLRIHQGIALVPEGRRVFADLSVSENLTIGGQIVDKNALEKNRQQVYAYFPRLRERQRQLAGSLSGGEQQMLAIGRALMSEPRYLLIDEMSLGLMPRVVDECYAVLAELRQQGVATLLVEQNTERALQVADQVLVLEAGNATWQGTAQQLKKNPDAIESLISLSTD